MRTRQYHTLIFGKSNQTQNAALPTDQIVWYNKRMLTNIHKPLQTNTLRQWQSQRLVELRRKQFQPSPYADRVTLLIYTFPMDTSGNAFQWIECSILHTWDLLGRLPTVVVAHVHFPLLDAFAANHPDVEIQIEPSLTPGSIQTMSYDCVNRLHERFKTDNVLIIQDDGFPIRKNISDFIDKYDFIGAPSVRDSRCWFANALRLPCLNGGFSLRSKRICQATAAFWSHWWKFLISPQSRFFSEDTFYTMTCCLWPPFRRRFRFATKRNAFAFAYDCLDGLIRRPQGMIPFGIHGKATFEQLAASEDAAEIPALSDKPTTASD